MKKIKLILLSLLLFSVYENTTGQSTVRVLNINTRMSGKIVNYDATPFADFIEQYDPDFVMLQEVDYKTSRNGKRDFTTELAAETGYFSAFGPAIEYDGGKYGVAILSKYPIEKISNTSLTGDVSEMKEKRTVLYIDVVLPNTDDKIRLAVTHLDHSTNNVRSAMVQQLNAAIGTSVPTILAGDFNALPSESAISEGMTSWDRVCNNFATYPSTGPSSKIDYIFAKPAGRWIKKSFRVLDNTSSLTDHCALLAEIDLQ